MSSKFDTFGNCFITLPSLYDGIDNQNTFSEDSNGLKYEKDVPVVILLGWAGCQWRYLKKYSAIYEKKCITICYIPSVENIFLRLGRLRCDAEKLLQFIVDHQLHENPVFVHTFSNGGSRVYRFLSDLVHNSESFASITFCGTIFDSTPSERYLLHGIRVFMSIWNYTFMKYLAAVFLFVWVVIASVVCHCAKCIPFISIPEDDYWEFMCEDPASCPQLYLYSVPDALAPYKDIEKMIAVRRSQGVHISTQRWDDSVHVAHLVAHRETYMTACLDFLQRCLQLM